MNWQEYFMSLAETTAQRSKDPSTKVGCIIADTNNRVIGTGYNGMIAGISEDYLWEPREKKYQYVIHAELNALLHTTRDARGATMYCTLEPCDQCMKAIATAGIKHIYFKNERINDVARHIAMLCQIGMEKL